MSSIKEKPPGSDKNGVVKEKKYWIKPGIEVVHREFPVRKMIVDKILRESKVIKNGEAEERKSFVTGVQCHWLTESGDYMKGNFFTNELMPYKKEANGVAGGQ